VLSIVGTNTTPRIYYCATDQGFYYWREGSSHITQITRLPMSGTLTRLATDATGKSLYGLSGRDLWLSPDSGTTWIHRWHFDRGDLVSLVVDPLNPLNLDAGFFLPPEVVYSKDGGNFWQILTD
jgi:hypothetical protein